MLDMSWGEVMLIGGVALIVIGPKDLPKALRTVGQVTTKLRRMAGEFQMQFNEAIREAELDGVRKEVDGIRDTMRGASAFNPVQTIRDELRGAVEGRAPQADPSPPVAGNEAYGPPKPEPVIGSTPPASAPPPVPKPRSLADATAKLRAERQGTRGAAEAPLPVPGSVDDPYGTPEPEAARHPNETAAQ
ncbi:Sec-independent protein translocase protein TatB [Methylobacterium sp. J-076]|uniref:Sec-independent protein translocase protein TatB n=1 Tax=Methylobacterium sp. J-076 TaxID=2836655 RepID=UPI001FBB98FD|nr:Sec-independent protein translocase protein TatB [Methylobacterium sp. J-076]MCJ2015385.1 Sec-independent protein translocase protein TatB [Methylobacterium sp. J-076]